MNDKRRDYLNRWNREHKAAIRSTLLAGKSCVRCNRREALELVPIPRLPGRRSGGKLWKAMLAGRQRYEVLCKWCHQKETHRHLKESGFYSRIARLRTG